MNSFKIEDHQILAQAKCKLNSPIAMSDQLIYCVSQNGDILKINEGKSEVLFTILGSPSSIAFKGMTGGFLIADYAHQSIFLRQENQVQQIVNLITEYNQKAFQGPSGMAINQFYSHMYFTDAGFFGQTSIQNKTGSVFLYIFEDKSLRCLSYRNLAYPWGITLDIDEKYLLVCEFGQNRILKFILDEGCSGNSSVFYQFSGRAGPSAICLHNSMYFCALFEYKQLASSGAIAILNQQGEFMQKIKVPTGAEINGLAFLPPSLQMSKQNNETLLVTEGNRIHRIKFKGDKNDMGEESEQFVELSGRKR